MVGTLVEISGQKRWTTELRLSSACSFSSGAGSCSIARSPLAELTVATAAMATSAIPYAAAEKDRGFEYRGSCLDESTTTDENNKKRRCGKQIKDTIQGFMCQWFFSNFFSLRTYPVQSLILVQACNQVIWYIRSRSNDDCYFIFNPFHLKHSTYFTFNSFHMKPLDLDRMHQIA
jgi:hypothetical protein